MSLLSQTCAEASRFISDSQDAPLSLAARLGLRLHLALCHQCQRYHRQLRLMRSAFSVYPQHLPTSRLPDEFRQQLVRKLERGG